MEVHTLAEAVVDRLEEMQTRMRQPLLWQVTDVLLRYEQLLNEARRSLEEADIALLARGVHKQDDTRRRLARAIEALR